MVYGGFWRRVGAWIIDYLIVATAVFAFFVPVVFIFGNVVILEPPPIQLIEFRTTETVLLSEEQTVRDDGAVVTKREIEQKITYFGLWSHLFHVEEETVTDGIITTTTRIGWLLDKDTKEKLSFRPSTQNITWVVLLIYLILMESSRRQATVGKQVMGLMVADESGKRLSWRRALGRNAAKVLSAITLFMGFMMVGWTQRKQGLHDKIARTTVIRNKASTVAVTEQG